MLRPPYEDRPVPRDVVERILENSRRAPSAGFSQGATFLVLEGDDVERFWELTLTRHYEDVSMTDLMPCPVVVLPLEDSAAYLERYSRPDKASTGLGESTDAWPVPYWTVDTAFATMIALLSATAYGLGGWFFGIFHGEEELLATCGVPPGARPIGAMTFGYARSSDVQRPTSPSRPTRKPLDERVRWGRW